MGISQQIGASSLIKPGVIDSSAARPASPYEGQVIFQKDTDQLLVWNGTAWVIPNQTTQNPEGLELITTATFSNAASNTSPVGVFSSSYQDYILTLTAINTNTTPISVYFNFMNSATLVNSSDYYFGSIYMNQGAGPTRSYDTAQPQLRILYADDTTGTSELTITKPNQAKKSGFTSTFNNWGSATNIMGTGYGLHNIATAYDGFRLTFHTSNATGFWTLYGKRNS